jgi:predicted XRE-type DNA-binding protein
MSKNVFEQIGFEKGQSEELILRTLLINDILKIVNKHTYSSKELQLILEQPQPEISYLLNGKISRFSSEKLIKFLNILGAKVEVNVKMPKAKIAV